MNTRLNLVLTVALLLPAATAAVWGTAVNARPRQQRYAVRYVCFTAAPEAGNPVRPEDVPPLFEALQRGADIPLGPDPQRFLGKLREADAGFEYQLVFSASAAPDRAGNCSVNVAPRSDDPYQISFTNQLRAVPAAEGTVDITHTGGTSFSLPGQTGRTTAGWDNGVRRGVVIGRTYSQGINGLPSGLRIIVVFSIFPARR